MAAAFVQPQDEHPFNVSDIRHTQAEELNKSGLTAQRRGDRTLGRRLVAARRLRAWCLGQTAASLDVGRSGLIALNWMNFCSPPECQRCALSSGCANFATNGEYLSQLGTNSELPWRLCHASLGERLFLRCRNFVPPTHVCNGWKAATSPLCETAPLLTSQLIALGVLHQRA